MESDSLSVSVACRGTPHPEFSMNFGLKHSENITQSRGSPITSLLAAAAMTDARNTSIQNLRNSSPAPMTLQPSAACDAELDMVQTMNTDIEERQNDTNFSVENEQTIQTARDADMDQVVLDHTRNGNANPSYADQILTTVKGANPTSAVNCETEINPLATFDPDPFLQGHFDYFDAQRYVLGPPDILPFDPGPCLQLNSSMNDFDSLSA